jgi:hypothetical protein
MVSTEVKIMSKKILSIVAAVGVLVLPVFANGPESGLKIGETVSAFNPTHVAGPLKGTSNCPPCTFGSRPQVQVWINGEDMKNVVAISELLEKQVNAKSDAEFKAFVMVLTDKPEETARALKEVADGKGFKEVGLAYLKRSDQAVKNYKVSLSEEVKNTIFVYRNKQVSEKFVNLKADEKGLESLNASIAKITD